MSSNHPIRGYAGRAGVVLLASVVVVFAWTGFRLWNSWQSVERIAFFPGDARTNMRDRVPTAGAPEEPAEPADIVEDEAFTVLIVGSDQRSVADLSRRADVIMLFVVPPDGLDPILLSIPRDLYLPDPCTGGDARINAALNGCGDLATGPELLTVVVEDFTGIQVDHFAVFDFEGFRQVIDRVGGVEICVDYPVRDRRTRPNPLSLPAGCTNAGGAQALAWVRSRHTQQLVDGFWRAMAVNDLTRNERQQELVIQGLVRLKDFRDVSELNALADDLAGTFLVDDGLRLGDAVRLAWDLRSLDVSRIVRPVIPTRGMLSPLGESVLRATEPFIDTMRAVHPDADRLFDSSVMAAVES
jgi:LCP family protein required for cell wall assembly